jgi:hypothetical protein
MPRRREPLVAVVAWAVLVAAARAEDLATFLERHDLRSTRIEWLLRQLQQGGAVARDAARALALESEWLDAAGSPGAEDRGQVLSDMVAAMPPTDRAAARPRMDLARREVSRVAREIDAMRGRPADRDRVQAALQGLMLVQEILAPLLGDPPARGLDPVGEWRSSARLLDGWRRVLQLWLARRLERTAPSREAIELQRAKLVFARLVDADEQSPAPSNASEDLLATESGADAALGLMVTLALEGRTEASAAWAREVQERAAGLDAARRLALWQLALAVDTADVPAMRRAMEAMPARSLPAELALAAASVASESRSADAEAVVAASIDAMPASSRVEWLQRLGEGSGRLRDLAQALRQAAERLPAWQAGGSEGAAASAQALRQALQATASPPVSLHGDALRLLGWALWRSGQGEEASRAFEQAAFTGAWLRSECLWLAAVASPAEQGEALDRRVRLLQAQRETDPQGPWAGRVAIWLSRLDGFPNAATAVAALLEVPLSDPFAVDARCEAARRILRQAGEDPDSQGEAARRALRAIEPVRAAPQAAPWVLIASLVPGVQDASAAAEAVGKLSKQDRADPAVASAVARWCAMQGDLPGVRAAVAAVEPDRRADTALRAAASLADLPGVAARTAEMELALQAMRGSDGSLKSAATDRLAQAVLANAEADAALDPSLAREVAAALRPVPGQPLALAEALRASGEVDRAISMLQQRSGASPQGSPAWLQTRWLLLRALESSDPQRARAMLAQHLALLPDGGVEPWGGRFRAAAARLGVKP